jgi:hypothetical protein
VISKLGWRWKIKSKFGKDPMKCEKCGSEMELWRVFVPGRGEVYSMVEDAPVWKEEVRAETRMEINAQLSFDF